MDYSNGKIYRLVCNTTNLQYIGSTCTPLHKRLWNHKKSYKQFLKGNKNYYTACDILEHDNYDIILIEDYPCERKEQLHSRERYWIENIECVNKVLPTRTDKEYNEANKEKQDEYQQKYRLENKERLTEYHKQYRLNNKEKIKNDHIEYRIKNKEKLDEYRELHWKPKVQCECGTMVCRLVLKRHMTSKKHLQQMQLIQPL